MEQAEVALEARGLGHVYEDGRRALENLTFEVRSGSTVGVVGPNGAGKTTLFLNLSGVCRPTEGDVHVFSQPFYNEKGEASSRELRRARPAASRDRASSMPASPEMTVPATSPGPGTSSDYDGSHRPMRAR